MFNRSARSTDVCSIASSGVFFTGLSRALALVLIPRSLVALVASVALVVLAVSASAKPPSLAIDRAAIERLDQYLSNAVPFGYAGAVLVAQGDQILLNKGYGLSNRAKGIPNTESTVFTTGSLTKQFTAAAIMKLEMMGKLSTEDTIDSYFENVPPDKKNVTLHQMLNLTSGFPDAVGHDLEPLSRDELVELAFSEPLAFEPGTEFLYSNVSYALLAAIVEMKSGDTFEEFLYSELLAPSGMESTGYRRPNWSTHQVAHWYVGNEDNKNLLAYDVYPNWNLFGNGGILSTTGDMYRWHRALMGNELLSEKAKERLYDPHLNDFAYGWDSMETPMGHRVGMDGGTGLGASANLERYLDHDLVILIFANETADGSATVFKVRDHVRGLVFGRDVEIPPAVGVVDPQDLGSYEGSWQLADGGALETKIDGGALLLSASDQNGVNVLAIQDPDLRVKAETTSARTRRLLESILSDRVDEARDEFGEVADDLAGFLPSFFEQNAERVGQIESVEVLAAIPRGEETKTTSRFVGTNGSLGLRLVWYQDEIVGIMPLRDVGPSLEFRLYPRADGSGWTGFNLGDGTGTNVEFDGGPGEPVDQMTLSGEPRSLPRMN